MLTGFDRLGQSVICDLGLPSWLAVLTCPDDPQRLMVRTDAAAQKHGTLKSYPGLPHGMPTTHADQINADLLAFIRS